MLFSVFDSSVCQLGESAFWHEKREAFLWLDILEKTLFEKNEAGELIKHSFSYTPSAIVPSYDSRSVLLVTDEGLVTYNLQTLNVDAFVRFDCGEEFRTNDAGLDPSGRIVFGLMEWAPTGRNGSVYRYDSKCGFVKLLDNIGIPNTFVWSEDGAALYMADSFCQKMYLVDYSAERPVATRELFDLSGGNATPDGSALFRGKLFNAEWDGARIAVRSLSNGNVESELPLPVLRPTSCAIGGKNMDKLLVTTASVDLTDEQIKQFPLSGQTFIANIKDLEIAGVI